MDSLQDRQLDRLDTKPQRVDILVLNDSSSKGRQDTAARGHADTDRSAVTSPLITVINAATMITINIFNLKVDTANVTFWLRTLLQQNSDLVEVVAKLEAGTR